MPLAVAAATLKQAPHCFHPCPSFFMSISVLSVSLHRHQPTREELPPEDSISFLLFALNVRHCRLIDPKTGLFSRFENTVKYVIVKKTLNPFNRLREH